MAWTSSFSMCIVSDPIEIWKKGIMPPQCFLRPNCISVWLLMETMCPTNVQTLITSSRYFLLILACLHIIAAFFLQAVTCPAVDVSHIMLEAYKKFILVSLVLHGKVRNHSWMVNLVYSYNIQLMKDFYGLLQNSLSVNVRGCLLMQQRSQVNLLCLSWIIIYFFCLKSMNIDCTLSQKFVYHWADIFDVQQMKSKRAVHAEGPVPSVALSHQWNIKY